MHSRATIHRETVWALELLPRDPDESGFVLERSLIALTPSPDLFVHARELLVEANRFDATKAGITVQLRNEQPSGSLLADQQNEHSDNYLQASARSTRTAPARSLAATMARCDSSRCRRRRFRLMT
jgi:hypothetical protein